MMMRQLMRKTVVYILSTPYAGSHYLSLMLGSHSQAVHLGEVNHLLNEARGRQSREVEFANEEIFNGIGPENISSLYDVLWQRLDPSPPLLIDNSKKVAWARRFVARQDFGRKYIHLIRDPRALVRRYGLNSTFKKVLRQRWRLFRGIPALRARIFLISSPRVWGYYWLWQNTRISQFLSDNNADARVVTYRDLAIQPAAEIARLMEWLGESFEPAQLEYWRFEHIGTEKKNYNWVKERQASYFDLRWQQDLPAGLQATVRDDPLVAGYLRSIGLHIVADGLTRSSNPDSAQPPLARTGSSPAVQKK
jgi:hypothetical protein